MKRNKELARQRLEIIFHLIEDAALRGDRCPGRDEFPHGCRHDLPKELALAGRIRVEVFAHNWRVVEICAGPNTGARTKAAPFGTKPHLVIDKNGTWRSGRRVIPKTPGHSQPSAPRPLTREEMERA